MGKSFKQSVIEGLKCYVYALVDPRDNHIFYIGKGSSNRVYQHAQAAIADDSQNLKLSTIREILSLGMAVRYYIIRHNLTEDEAYLVESAIIDLLTYPAFNTENLLTNIAAGHHQWDEGIKSVEEINALYDCAKIEPNPDDRLLLVSLNRSYNQSKASGVYRRANDYESARKYWKLSAKKVDKIKYILGVYRGIVRIVIEVTGKATCKIAEDGTVFKKPRYIFEGKIVSDSLYLNKDVTEYPFGSGGAVAFIPRKNF